MISVVLAVYNGENFILDSVRSILKQSLYDLELIIVDDGSVDTTSDLINSLNDPRIQLIRNSTRRKLAASLNIGITAAQGDFILRQDHDDISSPERCQTLLDHLINNPGCVMIGSCIETYLDSNSDPSLQELSQTLGSYFNGITGNISETQMITGNQLPNCAVMFRRSAWEAVNGYNEEYEYAQDFDFNLRLLDIGQLYKLPSRLYRYRIHDQQVSVTKRDRQQFFDALAKVDWCIRKGYVSSDHACRIWGAGGGGQRLIAACHHRNIPVAAVIDSDTEKNGSFIGDVHVCSPNAASWYDGKTTLIASSIGANDITDYLTQSGLVKNRDFLTLW